MVHFALSRFETAASCTRNVIGPALTSRSHGRQPHWPHACLASNPNLAHGRNDRHPEAVLEIGDEQFDLALGARPTGLIQPRQKACSLA